MSSEAAPDPKPGPKSGAEPDPKPDENSGAGPDAGPEPRPGATPSAAPSPARPTPLPSLAALRAFEAAARTLSFSAAAREMNVSHAAVAQNVRRLEAELGRPLMTRQGKGLALTADGVTLSRGLTDGFDSIRQALAAFAEEDAARPVQVTMTPSFAATFLMPRLGEFRRLHPEIELMLNPTAQVVDLAGGGVDLAIRYGDGDWPGLDSQPLVSSPLAILAAPRLLEDHEVTSPEDLPDLPWLQEYGTDEIAVWLKGMGVSRRPRQVAHMPGFMLPGALLEGQGVCGLARALVEDQIQAGRLVVLFEDTGGAGKRGYHLARRPGPMRAAVKDFATWLRREAKAAARAAEGGGGGGRSGGREPRPAPGGGELPYPPKRGAIR